MYFKMTILIIWIFQRNKTTKMEYIKMSQDANKETFVFVIEDEGPISDLICYSLKREGIHAEAFDNGMSALEKLNASIIPHLVILDLMLPDMDGYELCREITSKYSIPVIMLTAKSSTIDKVKGLEIGADDYITKPFDVLELCARVRTVLRRTGNSISNDIIPLGSSVSLNMPERKVYKKGEKVELTPKEFDLLAFLASNKGKVFTRESLLDNVWGFDFAGDTRTVDIHVTRLRKKLDASLIETIFGVGYAIPR
jgi:two-component system, OmpR family, alkaline phosphatase synthesis response regulator PhoP